MFSIGFSNLSPRSSCRNVRKKCSRLPSRKTGASKTRKKKKKPRNEMIASNYENRVGADNWGDVFLSCEEMHATLLSLLSVSSERPTRARARNTLRKVKGESARDASRKRFISIDLIDFISISHIAKRFIRERTRVVTRSCRFREPRATRNKDRTAIPL